MSRKDPRRRIVVRLSTQQRALLRRAVTESGRKGSLADRLRRIVTQELARGLQDLEAEVDLASGSGLPLQLPRKIRVLIDRLACERGTSPSCIVQQALAQHVIQVEGAPGSRETA